jgi:hypothetical protein
MTWSPSEGTVAKLAGALYGLFAGRRDVYGEGTVNSGTNKARYETRYEELGLGELSNHVRGGALVGVYPLVDGKVRWAAIDFDALKDDEGNISPDAFKDAAAQAQRQRNKFLELGLFSYIERSRSGTGVHLWLFLDDWVEGTLVRAALSPALLQSELLDRMYPVQGTAESLGKKLGNLIALPFNGEAARQGNSMFLDPETLEVLDPVIFLDEVRTNSATVVESLGQDALARSVPNGRLARLSTDGTVAVAAEYLRPPRPLESGVYKLLSPYGCEFMRQAWTTRKRLAEPAWYAMLGQLTVFKHGREAAHIMSRDHPKYSQRETDEKYSHAQLSPPVGCQFIHENFPRMACQGCPMTAPFRRAEVQLNQMHQEVEIGMQRGGFTKKLDRIWQFDSGEISSGIPSGLGGVHDQKVRWRPGELGVVGAAPSMGKTAMMLHKASSLGRRGIPARIFSIETGEDPLYMRLLAHRAGIDSKALRGERLSGRLTREERERLEIVAAELDREPITFNYNASRIEQIYGSTEAMQLEEGRGFDDAFVLFFDYLQYGQREAGETSDYEKVSRFIRDFKTLMKVMRSGSAEVYSQLTRKANQEDTPALDWFRDSGRIEADVDSAEIIHGERMEGRVVPRTVWTIKQKEAEANIRSEFLVDQATCTFTAAQAQSSDARPSLLSEDDGATQLGLQGSEV